ncbi:MAG: cell division protein ZapA [Clostridia bacterium]|nr:cell division protein ZapA [Clostridia bacterium]
MGKNKISISVAGNEFVVSTDEEREYTLQLAETVDKKIRGLLGESSRLNLGLAAILTALDLCDENEKNKASCARLREEIRRYLAQLEKLSGESEASVAALKRENAELRNQLLQYQLGQIGFES